LKEAEQCAKQCTPTAAGITDTVVADIVITETCFQAMASAAGITDTGVADMAVPETCFQARAVTEYMFSTTRTPASSHWFRRRRLRLKTCGGGGRGARGAPAAGFKERGEQGGEGEAACGGF
jgi:hypothetical protein